MSDAQDRIGGQNNCGAMVLGESARIRDALRLAKKAAKSDITVLLEGESGVGKEVFAQHIHQNSKRADGPFFPVHCAAIPDTLFEAELFGFERGAFTNAFVSHRGYFEQADGGTIFLDEISEIPLNLQVKLLRVLEEKHVLRLGSEKRIHVDVRIIAASQHRLLSLVKQRRFRDDLYYRLAVWVISIPPLRERKEDIGLLAQHFLSKNGGGGWVLSNETLTKLCRYDWPGNVRELESVILQAVLMSDVKEIIGPEDLQFEEGEWHSLESTRRRVEQALREAKGCVKRAAAVLGVHRNTVYNLVKRHRLDLALIRLEKEKVDTGVSPTAFDVQHEGPHAGPGQRSQTRPPVAR